MRSPRASGLRIPSPLRNTPSDLPRPADQSSRCHLGAIGVKPSDIRSVRARRLAVKEMAAAEDSMRTPERDQPLSEREQGAVFVLPVKPRDLVVLTVGVVVAALRSTDLVAAEQHRDALGKQERREEVSPLPSADFEDFGVVGRSLDTGVP